MILDELRNRDLYVTGDAWRMAFNFIVGLDPECEERRYDLLGTDMYAMVESYETRLPESALPEAHRTYIDIQVLLSGREQIRWWSTPTLTIHTPHDSDRDIAFYESPADTDASLVLAPGRFALFHPDDAHMPGLQTTSGASRVKKVVVKIAVELVQSEHGG